MDTLHIILTGLLLTAAGCAVLLLLPPVFRLPWSTAVKRCLWFTIALEAAVAAVFCVFNGVRPTVTGQLWWHIARLCQVCILGVLDRRLLLDRAKGWLTVLYVIIGSVAAQVIQYFIVTLIY